MRKLLDSLYDASAALAAACMIGLLVMVMLSIFGRLLHFHVKGTDAYAGYLMAGAGFLALAHTLKRGEHIRVTLFLTKLKGRMRQAFELWSLGMASALAGVFAFYSARLVYQSWQFNDISTSNDATPLWIPQLLMAAGSLILFIAFIDEFFLQLAGKRVDPSSSESLHNE